MVECRDEGDIKSYYSDYSYVCGELRFAVGLGSPRARELLAASAELGARVRTVLPEQMPELVTLIKERTAPILADPDLPPEFRRSVSV